MQIARIAAIQGTHTEHIVKSSGGSSHGWGAVMSVPTSAGVSADVPTALTWALTPGGSADGWGAVTNPMRQVRTTD